jgi:hypothetical protein
MGLLAGARGRDIHLLLVGARLGHDVGAVDRGALGAVGGDGVTME